MPSPGIFMSLDEARAAVDDAVAAVAPRLPHLPRPVPSKCGGCGSLNFVERNGKEVCAYCRGDRA